MKKLGLILLLFFFSFSFAFSQTYSHIYENIKKVPSRTYSDIYDLYKDIVKDNYTDAEKVYAFARYITENVQYGKRARIPINTINSREGVCQDYSELFIELCKIANIENNYISGDGRNSSSDIGFYNSNHSWNIVKVNGEYQIFDLTWAAGGVLGNKFIKDFNPFYFNAKPELFILNHFPDDEKWQLLSNPITKNQYINQPTYDQSIYNLSLKKGIVRDNNFQISFNSDSEFHSVSIFKWSLNEYGSASGIDIPLIKNGNSYKLNISESITGAYRYEISLWSYIKEAESSSESISSSIKFKLITPDFRVSKPISYDKKDPWGLIESYHYIFHSLDFIFFKQINPNTSVIDFKKIKYYSSLNKSLSNWYGDYKKYYVNMRGEEIYYPIDNFRVILTNTSNGYMFKEITRQTLRIGKSGYGVKEIQQALGLNATGIFDNELEIAVKKFQTQNNLKADGIVGKMTYNILGM